MSLILVDRYEMKKVVDDKRNQWVCDILIALGADKDIITNTSGKDFLDYLSILEIELWRNYDETIDIFRRGKLVAQWKVPGLKLLKKDKKYYYEVKINEWALPFQINKRENNG